MESHKQNSCSTKIIVSSMSQVIPLSCTVHWCKIPGKQKAYTKNMERGQVIIARVLPKVSTLCIQFYIICTYSTLLKSDSLLPCKSFASLHCDIKGFFTDWVAFYIFSALMFLWHRYPCKVQGFWGSGPCSSCFIATRWIRTSLTQNVGMGSHGELSLSPGLVCEGYWRPD